MRILDERPTTHFPAPRHNTAPAPSEWRGLARDEVRLLVAGPDGLAHARFHDLPDHLHAGDLLVVNTSATAPAELDVDSDLHGPVVLHVATPVTELPGGGRVVELRTAPHADRAVLDARPGEVLLAPGARIVLEAPYGGVDSAPTADGNRLWRARVRGDLTTALRTHGRPIAYGYLDRRYPLTAYQTVFGTTPGSAEMPSAGRPFTPELVTRLVTRGVAVAPVLLHTGVSSQEAGEAPQAEWFEVPDPTARLVEHTRACGHRVVAVGTTATRALESAVDATGSVHAASGWTDRVVTPARPPRVVDGLVTGWHDPLASHLLLVEAVAGPGLTQAAYRAAAADGYLWHEFGDSALLLPRGR